MRLFGKITGTVPMITKEGLAWIRGQRGRS